jgi:D-glycero-D-manno-heptose 1,7-bisphosphate phosphatase
MSHTYPVRGAAPSAGPWVRRGQRAARPQPAGTVGRPAAVLFDRDGTLVADVPHNRDPGQVRLMPTARAALDTLRAAGTAVGIVTNQPGLGRGVLTRAQVLAVHRRLTELLGEFQVTAVCPHVPVDGCGCRKPAPGLVHAACAELGVQPRDVVVVGDIGRDMEAARASGAGAVLVPTAVTLPDEVAAAPRVAPDLLTAVRALLTDGQTSGGTT